MQKTERLMAITLLLQARGKMTAKRLAEILGVTTRTIYRDIIALSLAHVPVAMEYGPGGGYYLPSDYHFESAIFTREEAISLILSADMSGNFNLFAGDDDLHRALMKLEAALPEEYREDVQTARERILLDTSEWYSRSIPTTYLETVRAAVLSEQQLEILYPGTLCVAKADTVSGTLRCRRVEPYGLVLKSVSRRHVRTGVWYLVAFCLSCQQFHPFRLSYIEQLRVCEEKITPRPDFNLRAYWLEARKHLDTQKQPYILKMRVSPAVRYSLHSHTTTLHEEPSGHAVVHMEFESFDDAVSYVLGLGANAVVICPAEVRNAVATTAQAIAQIYG